MFVWIQTSKPGDQAQSNTSAFKVNSIIWLQQNKVLLYCSQETSSIRFSHVLQESLEHIKDLFQDKNEEWG